VSALELAVAAVNLVVFGAHVLVPRRLADADEAARRRWAFVALPALLAAVVLTVFTIGLRPDEAIAWGLVHPVSGSTPARAIALATAALALADAFLLFAWRRLEPAAWRALAAFGALALAAQCVGAELLRIGYGPWSGTASVFLAAALRAPLALAAAEVAAGAPRLWPLVAAPSLVALAFLWPAALKLALARDLATLAAAAALLALARFAPASLRRAAAAAGIVLALLFLTRSAELSRTLGVRETAHEFELRP
jgi:hypothetical protein